LNKHTTISDSPMKHGRGCIDQPPKSKYIAHRKFARIIFQYVRHEKRDDGYAGVDTKRDAEKGWHTKPSDKRTRCVASDDRANTKWGFGQSHYDGTVLHRCDSCVVAEGGHHHLPKVIIFPWRHWRSRVQNTACAWDLITLSVHPAVKWYLTLFRTGEGERQRGREVAPHLSYIIVWYKLAL